MSSFVNLISLYKLKTIKIPKGYKQSERESICLNLLKTMLKCFEILKKCGPEGLCSESFRPSPGAREQAKPLLCGKDVEVPETIQLVAIVLDRGCNITFSNDFPLHLTGCRIEEVTGRSWFHLFIPYQGREQANKVFASVLAG